MVGKDVQSMRFSWIRRSCGHTCRCGMDSKRNPDVAYVKKVGRKKESSQSFDCCMACGDGTGRPYY